VKTRVVVDLVVLASAAATQFAVAPAWHSAQLSVRSQSVDNSGSGGAVRDGLQSGRPRTRAAAPDRV